MEMKFNVKPPTPPNFIAVDGIDKTIPIENLTEMEAKQYAQLLADNFIDHWKNKRQDKKAAESVSGPQFIKEQIDKFQGNITDTDSDKRVKVTGVKHHSID